MQSVLKGILGFILAFVPFATVHATEPYGDMLQEADRIRSSDPKRFSELLARLERRKSEATRQQGQQLRYLSAFRSGAYSGKVSDGIRQAIRLYKEADDVDLKFRSGSLVANLSAVNRDFSTGLRYLDSSLAMRNNVKDRSIRHDGIGAAAVFYNQMGQYSLGLKYANEMLSDSPSPRAKCFATSLKIESQSSLGLLPDDLSFFDQAIADCLKINELMAATTLRATFARALAKSGEVDRALIMLEREALPDAIATRYARLVAEIRSILAELRLKKGDVAAAEAQADAATSLSNEIMSTQPLVDAYGVLYQVAMTRGDAAKALEYYRQYAEADKARLGDVKARELAYVIFRHQTQQQTQQIQLLQQNNKVLRLQQKLASENEQKAQLATVFLLLLLAGIVFWAFMVKRHHQQLQRLAQTDSLTGLGNRHYFTVMSEKSLVEAARAGEAASLVMFDLDHFKAINDTYGHGAGDWVLKQVGKTCAAHCRKIDYIGRIGGEEFAVLLRGIDLAMATRLAEDCRVQLAKIDTRECGYSFVVTGSFGVSSTAQSGYDLSRLLSHADQMLYRAKNEGRNRVCAYTSEAAADHRSFRRSPALTVVNN